ncbi:hypothetical protein Poly24_25050 [Rosistilla carotiformis]|uniref:Uncharacterized protein n=1 Tax=Rosistilla carotiformis TaxID=2528017 RepID=A0A518JTC2_9BACT|nr:hypothetical protein Poly24_25050 [Rosistilla carotiformis]
MPSFDTLILITGILRWLGIASNALSPPMGFPVRLLFRVDAMLARSDGIDRIQCENDRLTLDRMIRRRAPSLWRPNAVWRGGEDRMLPKRTDGA